MAQAAVDDPGQGDGAMQDGPCRQVRAGLYLSGKLWVIQGPGRAGQRQRGSWVTVAPGAAALSAPRLGIGVENVNRVGRCNRHQPARDFGEHELSPVLKA